MTKAPFPRLCALAFFASASFLLGSCASAPVVIPADLSSDALVQRGQEAADASNWELAVRYYQALAANWGSDPAKLLVSEYEIAFIRYKQGNSEEARKGFMAVLARYQAPDAASLPPRYKVLAGKILASLK